MSQFIQKSGFKVLALARLSECEYSVILYLMNCAVSGLDQIITTEAELAGVITYEEEEVAKALESLASRHLIKAHYSDHMHAYSVHPSIRLGVQFDLSRWQLDYEEDVNSHDAVVYPFLRNNKTHLEVLKSKKTGGEGRSEQNTWERVVESFLQGRSLDDDEIEGNTTAARILMETHPVDQVLLLLRHFKHRVPSLSLLASNWDHFQEVFESETQRVDLMDARKKHQELDQKLKDTSKEWLENADDHKLTPAEINILKLLIRHRHPRRQLFWAWQARSRYTNLNGFFEKNSDLMLAVTTTGAIVRKPHPSD